MAKKKKGIVAGVVGVLVLIGILSPDKSVTSINLSIPNYQSEYDINTDVPVDVVVIPENANASLEYVSSGVTLNFSEAGIGTGSKEGQYSIRVKSGNVESNTIYINVGVYCKPDLYML